MKFVLLLLIILISAVSQAQNFFSPLGGATKTENTLELMARMSVYSLMCDRAQPGRFSQKYRALFTEKNRGMVEFEGSIFTNPIEKMRNMAMLNFSLTMNTHGLEGTCNMYVDQYSFFINKTPDQLVEYAEAAD